MKIVEAKKRPTEYYYKVLVNPTETNEEKRIYEEFRWGLEPPAGVAPGQYLQDIRAQVKAHLTPKYGPQPSSTTLPSEGSNL